MRRVRSQFLQPVFRLSSVVRGRGVSDWAGVRSVWGIGASLSGLAVVGVALALCAPVAQGATPGVLNFWGSTFPSPAPVGGEFPGTIGPSGVAVSDASGEVYVTDKDGHRVQRFTAAGGFIAAWGFDVVQSGQAAAGDVGTNVYEVCTAATACKAGINTVNAGPEVGTAGQLSRPTGIAVNQDSGHVYVLDPGFSRVQEFTADGDFVRTFGQDVVKTVNEVQTVTVNAGAGDFKLSFDGQTTGDLDWNAPASGVGSVQAELNALSSIAPGSVTVAGGPGAPGGGTYTVTFSTGAGIAGTDVPEIEFVAGTNGLSGGSGPGADTVAVATETAGGGGSTGFEVCTVAVNCKAGTTGSGGGAFGNFGDSSPVVNTSIAVAPAAAPNAGNVLVADNGNRRVQEFTATGEFVRAFGGGVTTAASPGNVVSNERQEIAVSASGGTFTLAFGANTTGALPFDVPASGGVGPTASVENALNALASVSTGGGSVSVSGGPGDGSGSSPYVVDFDGGPRADSDVAQIVVNGGGLTVAPGVELSCAGGPTVDVDLSYQWLANGEPLGDANGAQTAKYTVQAADVGKTVQCQVTAINKAEDSSGGFVGSRQVSNPALLVSPVPAPAPPTAPANIAAPAGTPTIGQNLTCNAGSWGGSPVSYTYQWIRGGTEVVETETKATTSDTYTVTEQDLEKRTTFQCAVTASNLIGPGIGGATTKVSANRNTSPTPSPSTPTATATVAPATVTTTAVGSAGFEVCTAADGDTCQAGSAGTGAPGQFSNSTPNRIAEAPDGSIYTVEKTGNLRVQKFSLPANTPTPQGVLLPDKLSGTTSNTSGNADEPRDIAVDGNGHVYVAKNFPAGTGEPPVEIPLVASDGASGALSRYMPRILKVDPNGNEGEGEVVDTLMTNPGEFFPTYESTTGLTIRSSGDYLYATTLGSVSGPRKMIFRLGEVPPVGFTSPSFSNVRAATATVHATVTPSPIPLDTFYQFEYSTNGVTWEPVSAKPVNIGNGSGVGDSGSCPVGNPATCEIEADLQDLAVGIEYQVRLIARTAYSGSRFVSPVESFTTEPSPPSVTTRSADWSSSPNSGNASLVLRGLVNPEGADTSYRFEYVPHAQFAASGFDAAKSVPAAGGSGGHGTSGKAVTQVVNGLDPSVPYHYRLVASNAEGTSTGDDRTVEPASDAGRFVELVSDGSNNGIDISTSGMRVSDDGERVLFPAQTFDDQVTGAGIVLPFVSVRGSSGWTVTQSSPGLEATAGNFGDLFEASADLGRVLWNTPTKSQRARGEVQWMFTDEAGEASPASDLISPLDLVARPGAYDFLGGAEDLSSFVFSGPNAPGTPVSNARATLVPGEVLLPQDASGRGNIYEVADAGSGSPVLRIVNRDSDGNQLGGACGAELGGVNSSLFGGDSPGLRGRSVSVDGSVVFFTARAGTSATVCNTGFGSSPLRLFKRVDGEETVAVSAPQCTPTPVCPGDLGGNDLFLGASMDGSKVYFRTTRRLVNSDADSTDDLYLYDSSPPEGQPSLVQVSAGEAVAPEHPTVGAGAQVLGVADVAADGSRVYFIAEGRLTAEATQAGKNLFLYERNTDHPEGRIAFVATISAAVGDGFDVDGDDDIWATIARSDGRPAYALPFYDSLGPDRGPGDGRYLVLGTVAALLPEDEDSVEDAYRYDAVTGDMVCLSCVGDGNSRVQFWTKHDSAAPDFVQQHRVASEDVSRVVFRTDEQLTEGDTNTVDDVYEWHDGVVSLVSGATGEVGVATGSSAGNRGPAISPDGQTVLFETRASLLPQDNNNVGYDWYALRAGGGFVQQGTDQPDCQASAAGCQTGGSDPAAADPRTSPSSGSSENAKPDVRKTLAVSRLSKKARRKASRTGRLPLVVRLSTGGKVSLVARARIGNKVRRVGRVSRRVKAGRTKVVLRLSSVARKRLRSGRALRLTVSVRQAGARGRTISVLLPGGRS